MPSVTDPITVDAEPYIARLRTQLTEAWGQAQAELALAHEQIRILTERLVFLEGEGEGEEPGAASTRP